MFKKFVASSILFIGLAHAAHFQYSIQPIPASIQKKMLKVTWHKGCPVALSQLAYVTLSYWGFDHQSHTGTLILNKHLAKSIVVVFKQLYKTQFPIESIKPMYEFNGNDNASMTANNTSAFNCRLRTGYKNKYSRHAYGRAIDINPALNPYVNGKTVLPTIGRKYLDRSLQTPGMITKNSSAYQAFKSQGWSWGGNWRRLKDYQHFQRLW